MPVVFDRTPSTRFYTMHDPRDRLATALAGSRPDIRLKVVDTRPATIGWAIIGPGHHHEPESMSQAAQTAPRHAPPAPLGS